MKPQMALKTKAFLLKNRLGHVRNIDFKTYPKAIIIKIA